MNSASQTTLLQLRGKVLKQIKQLWPLAEKKEKGLKASGSLPGDGIATMRAEQDSEELVPRK